MRPHAEPARWDEDTVPLPRALTDTLEFPAVPDDGRARRRPPRRRWPAAVLTLLLLIGSALALGLGLTRGGSPGGSNPSGGTLAVRAVTSVDPSGGSGWRRSGDDPTSAVWRTQHYRSARFGGLKSGVGLLLDLGTPHRVTSIGTAVAVSGTTVELRASNSTPARPSGFAVVDRIGSAGGRTTLDAGGSSFRYWLIWVPRLGRDAGGYSAELRGLTVRG